jgi:cation diffusion facilitator CzcD-associated flavoprotein CzcO
MLNAAIIGAGLAGLCAAIQMKQSGIDDFVVFEKSSAIGGVWRDNTYPGAGCDIPSCLYSYSFEPHGEWTRTYADQSAILDYLVRCARRHGIPAHIRFDTEVVSARYDPHAKAWLLRTADGGEHAARALITATGQLNRPRLPELEGASGFRGTAFHSARWDHGHDLAGKSVAVIGNGCSAAQFVPRIAPQVERLAVFQRSPKWIIPKLDREYWAATQRTLGRHGWARRLERAVWFLMAESIAYSPVRQGAMTRGLSELARRHLQRQVPDPVLRAKLTPHYPFGCNRMILSNDYYPALMRQNVELVTDRIRRLTPDGIETADGRERAFDTVIYATGFESTDFLAPIEVEGPAGRLHDRWRNGASAYLGMTVPGFPNLFILYGPNTSSANNSVVYMLENQVRYLIHCLGAIGDGGAMEVRRAAFEEYNRRLTARIDSTVWKESCTSWYKTDSGMVTNLWPERAYRYRVATRRPEMAHYRTS